MIIQRSVTQPAAALKAAVVDAYTNLTRDQLVLFLSVRGLAVDGSSLDLANRLAQHDLDTYKASPLLQSFPSPPEIAPKHPPPSEVLVPVLEQDEQSRTSIPSLPAEIIADIMDHLGDWELAKAVGTVTALKKPKDWTRATLVDEAALSGSIRRMRAIALPSPSEPSTSAPASPFSKLTQVGANAIVRLGYIHILDYLRLHDRPTFDRLYGGPTTGRTIPLRASASGRTEVLSWWKEHADVPKSYGAECIDEASKYGQLDVLDWWFSNTSHHPDPAAVRTRSHVPGLTSALSTSSLSLSSSLSSVSSSSSITAFPISSSPLTSSSLSPSSSSSPSLALLYTEAALENASSRGHVHILKWWAQSGLPLRVGRVMDLASKMGHTDVLEWWKRSGLEVKYDSGCLEHASRSGRVDVLSWWLGSGYRMMFNEEVLLSATRHNRPEVLQWWYDSGLTVHYRICDIEEALEDAIRPGDQSRKWWNARGVDFLNSDNSEWMGLKTLR